MSLTKSARRIRNLRERTGWSRAQFAGALGVSERTVYRWEFGEMIPSRLAEEKLQKLEADFPVEQPAGVR